jgi:hypothetical protein
VAYNDSKRNGSADADRVKNKDSIKKEIGISVEVKKDLDN